MAQTLVRHITKLTAMILVLAAIAASAFIQEVHVAKLRRDGAALKLVARRHNPPGAVDGVQLEAARDWLRRVHPEIAAAHDGSRKALADALVSTGVPEPEIRVLKSRPIEDPGSPARWALLRIEEGPETAVEALVPEDAEDDSVARMLAGYLAVHRATTLVPVTAVTLDDSFARWREGETAGATLESVLLQGDGVEVVFTKGPRESFANQMPILPVSFRVPAASTRVAGPSLADLRFGRDEEADALAADEGAVSRLVRLYGDLSMSEAQGTVSRAVTARFNAVSLLGVQVPAEYFAVALVIALAAVLAGLVGAMSRARSAGATPLNFAESDAISSLLLGFGLGRLVLWMAVPVLATAAVWPESWMTRAWLWVFGAGAALVAVLGVWAVRLGRVTTRPAAGTSASR
jgi:hypothetical protein